MARDHAETAGVRELGRLNRPEIRTRNLLYEHPILVWNIVFHVDLGTLLASTREDGICDAADNPNPKSCRR